MKPSIPAGLACAVALLAASPATAQDGGDAPPPFTYARIYADAAGESHFADEALELTLMDPGRGIQPTPASAPLPAAGLRVFCPPPSASVDWHPVPRRVYNVVLSGEIEIEVSDGETRRFGPGSVILGEDTAGRGHRTRIVADEARACFAMVPIPE